MGEVGTGIGGAGCGLISTMTSHAITISRNHLDVYLIDTREYGAMVPDRFSRDIWLD